MSDTEVMKVKPWGKDQGDHVLILKSDFDESIHEPFDAPAKTAKGDAKPSDGMKVDEIKAALEAKGIEIPEGAKKAELAALLDSAE